MSSSLPSSSQPTPNSPTPSVKGQQASAVDIDLTGADRWLFVGKTGSGKSYLARALLREKARRKWPIIIIDPSGYWMGKDPKWETKGPGTIEKPRLVTRYDPKAAVQLYIPRIPGWTDAGLDAIMDAALKRGNGVLYFDETIGIVTANQFSPEFARAVTQGRKHGLAVWAATQRPTRVPEILLSQAEHWAIFRMITPQDRKKAAEYTGSSVTRQQRIPLFYWFYWTQKSDDARLMAPIPKHGRL